MYRDQYIEPSLVGGNPFQIRVNQFPPDIMFIYKEVEKYNDIKPKTSTNPVLTNATIIQIQGVQTCREQETTWRHILGRIKAIEKQVIMGIIIERIKRC